MTRKLILKIILLISLVAVFIVAQQQWKVTEVIAGIVAGLFFVFPYLIERYNLFHVQPYFTHDGQTNGTTTGL